MLQSACFLPLRISRATHDWLIEEKATLPEHQNVHPACKEFCWLGPRLTMPFCVQRSAIPEPCQVAHSPYCPPEWLTDAAALSRHGVGQYPQTASST